MNVGLVRAARAGGHQGALRRSAEAARRLKRRQLQARKTQLEQVGKDLGQQFRVLMPKDDQYKLVSERLVALDVSSLIDWSYALEEISTAIQDAGLLGEKFTIVPTRNGKPVAPLAMSLISSLLPAGDLGQWTSSLAEAHETPLTDPLDAAIASLHVASGLLALPEAHRSHGIVDQVVEDAKHEFIQSRQILEQSSRDAITEQIAQLLDSLNDALLDEEAGESAGGGHR